MTLLSEAETEALARLLCIRRLADADEWVDEDGLRGLDEDGISRVIDAVEDVLTDLRASLARWESVRDLDARSIERRVT